MSHTNLASQTVSENSAEVPQAALEAEPLSAEPGPCAPTKSSKRKAKGKAKRKAKGKAKSRGKVAKGRAKAKARGQATHKVEAEGSVVQVVSESAPKAKGGLRNKFLGDLGHRDVDEVMAETSKEVEAYKAALAEEEQRGEPFDDEIAAAKQAMEDAAAAVEAAAQQEAAALEKLRVTKLAKGTVAVNTRQLESDIADCVKVLKILHLELASRDKVTELEEAKRAAIAASEAAKLAVEESKHKEKQAQEALKASLVQQRHEEAIVLKEGGSDKVEASEARRERRLAERAALKEAAAELAQLERARALREKERQQRFREACGAAKCRHLKALTMGTESDCAVDLIEASPAKVARVCEVA